MNIYDKYNINENKLIRDYLHNPLQHIETEKGKPLELPYKEDLQYLYIKLNLRRKDICEILKISTSTFKKFVNIYNIKKGYDQIYENTIKGTKEKYGVENYTQTKEWHKLILEQNNGLYPTQTEDFKKKSEITKEQKYGNSHFNNVEKRKETCLLKYGVENYTQTKEYQSKKNTIIGTKDFIENTYKIKLEKYGNEKFNNKEKISRTMLKRYGTEYPQRIGKDLEMFNILDNKERFEQYILERNIDNVKILSESMKIEVGTLNRYITKYELRHLFNYQYSKGEKEICEYINQYYKTLNNIRTIIPPYELDIYIPEIKKAIEYNGNYWHNYNIFPEKKERDELKFKLCEETGIKLLTIWEQDFYNNKNEIFRIINNFIKD